MNDDVPTELLEAMRVEHRAVDARIEAMRADPDGDQLEIARLKKRKLRLRDEIARIEDDAVPDIIA